MARASIGIVFGFALGFIGCGSGTGASVKLELKNTTGAGAVHAASVGGLGIKNIVPILGPARFAMRLGQVYLAEDVDPATMDNSGNTARIWASPNCPTPSTCDYFDFARGTAAVNADLNSQALDVQPGTYRYVRLEFCIGGPPAQGNVSWQAGAMASAREFSFGECGVTSTKFDPPLQIVKGDSVSVALAYDLASISASGPLGSGGAMPGSNVLVDDQGHWRPFIDCADDATTATKTCIDVPGFAPSATK